jgi:hypothetical protein
MQKNRENQQQINYKKQLVEELSADLSKAVEDFFFVASNADYLETLNDLLANWSNQPDFTEYNKWYITQTIFNFTQITNLLAKVNSTNSKIKNCIQEIEILKTS